jgi:hypothetical protein
MEWFTGTLAGEPAFSNGHFLLLGALRPGDVVPQELADGVFDHALDRVLCDPLQPTLYWGEIAGREGASFACFGDRAIVPMWQFVFVLKRFPTVELFLGAEVDGHARVLVLMNDGKVVGCIMPFPDLQNSLRREAQP